MSHASYYPSSQVLLDDLAVAHPQASLGPVRGYKTRPGYLPLLFVPSTILCGLSWLMNGVPFLTDLGFLILTCVCAWLTIMELVNFPRRFGVGGIVLFGGVLLWFCYDYMCVWFGVDFRNGELPFGKDTVAKSAFFHCLFITMMSIGLLIRSSGWLGKLLHRIPDPASNDFYFWLTIGLFVVGISPYFLFAVESPFKAIWLDMISNRGGGAHWTVGRSGNINYNWGGYVAQILQLGQFGGILAIFYAVLIGRTAGKRLLATGIWLFWLAMAIGSGTRGNVAVMLLPAIGLLYIKYQAFAVEHLKRFSTRAYVIGGVLAVAAILFVQIQGYFRGHGLANVEMSDVSMTNLQGNRMFSEGLDGFDKIPKYMPFFANEFPGEGAVRAIPQTLFWFAIGPFPRALWNNKPIDAAWEWRAETDVYGRANQGTTISSGLVGYWYFRYGAAGVIEGGILVGWLMVCGERALQDAAGRPLVILFSLAFVTWLFQTYRDFIFISLYPVMIGAVFMWIANRLFGGSNPQPQAASY